MSEPTITGAAKAAVNAMVTGSDNSLDHYYRIVQDAIDTATQELRHQVESLEKYEIQNWVLNELKAALGQSPDQLNWEPSIITDLTAARAQVERLEKELAGEHALRARLVEWLPGILFRLNRLCKSNDPNRGGCDCGFTDALNELLRASKELGYTQDQKGAQP